VKPGVPFILVTMLLDWLVVGMLSPVLPNLLVAFEAGRVSNASAILGGFSAAFAVAQFVASPVLGVLSDRYGRRPIVLLSSVGSTLDCLILAIAPDLAWLFVGRVLSGGTAASATTGAAYVADVTPPERRPAAFGLIGMTFGVGFALGPALGGLLAGIGLRVPFYVAAGMMAANAIYGAFVLPESLPPASRQPRVAWGRANPLGSLRLLRRHRALAGLAGSILCSNLAVQAFSIFVLYTIFRFHWSPEANGLGLTLFGLVSIIGAVVVGRLVTRLGARAVTVGGYALGIAGFVIYGLAPTGALFALALPLTGLWAIAGPPVQAAMSRHVSALEQGELQGAIGAIRSIAMIVGPPFFTLLFAAVSAGNATPLAGVPWFCGALLLAVAVAFALRAIPSREANVRK